MEKALYRISVRNLVEFIERSGDLDDRKSLFDHDAMQKGSRLHRKIQKSKGKNYQAEVVLKETISFEDLSIQVEGRADGIVLEENHSALVEEIKGIAAGLHQMEAPAAVHLAQAKCYGAILARQKELEQIRIQMTYGDLETEETRRFESTYLAEELWDYFERIVKEYHKWLSFRQEWKELRDTSMEHLVFPFSYREGQKRIVSGIYHAITEGRQIFVQAPTGTGKTMSAVYPAVRALKEGKGETIFYLTAKTITRTVAQDAFQLLMDKGLRIKVITLTSKERLCPMEQQECNPDACPYAKGHFDRVNDAVFELLQQGFLFDRETILAQSEKWQVCPFEMSLDLALWMDGVICDYNYVFDPDVYLKRFFGEDRGGSYLFLIDEAHNLADRAREMYSASLSRSHVLETKKKVREISKPLARALTSVNRQLLEFEKNEDANGILQNPGSLPISLLRVQGEIDKLREQKTHKKLLEEIQDFYFEVRSFLNIAELLDDNYVVYTETDEQKKCRVRLFCVNPAENLRARLQKGVFAAFFSATLLPMDYYRHLLSVREDDYGLYLPSPFEQKNRRILISRDVSTVYSRRGYDEYRKIASYIARMVWSKKGNYMIFFPSYRMLEDVWEIYEKEFAVSWVQTIRQQQEMTEQEREGFLQEFERNEDSKRSLAAFCIMGGIFSEGIDLAGEKLIGTMVVGAGLPMVAREREILKGFYDRKEKNSGFDYAYRYPGINKVLQAAGRVIRTPSDRGIILLLDDRFLRREYASLLPEEWRDRKICSLSSVEQELAEFWDKT